MICELQIRTLSQDVWAEMDHDFSYKSDLPIPQDIKRSIYRLSALLEILDNGCARVRQSIDSLLEVSEYGILSLLEIYFIRFVGLEYDKVLSMEVIRHLVCLYQNASIVKDTIRNFIERNSTTIQNIFEQYNIEDEHPILLYQPEIFMIFDRLEADEYKLKDVWLERYPIEELEGIARVWGKPLE
jgi:hypothetical protein